MEFTTCYCPHPQCTHYGQRGFDAHLVRCGADRGIPRLLCTMCQSTFSVRHGTAYFGVRAEGPNYTIAMRALAEGNSARGSGRIGDVDKDTVCDWVDRAGRHCRAVTTYLFDTLHITECQLDELWSFVRKKEAHLTVAEKVLALYGDAWVWIAFAPAWRLVAAFVVGKRDPLHFSRFVAHKHWLRSCASPHRFRAHPAKRGGLVKASVCIFTLTSTNYKLREMERTYFVVVLALNLGSTPDLQSCSHRANIS